MQRTSKRTFPDEKRQVLSQSARFRRVFSLPDSVNEFRENLKTPGITDGSSNRVVFRNIFIIIIIIIVMIIFFFYLLLLLLVLLLLLLLVVVVLVVLLLC